MSNLWLFGDSYTDSFKPIDWQDWRTPYVEWKGYVPKVYGEIISEKYNFKLNNLATPAACNYTIFQSICDNIHRIKKDDIVIIGWTVVHRFRFVQDNHWQTLFPDIINRVNVELSNESIKTILVNRMHKLYAHEVNSWIKIINYALPENNILHWSWWDNPDLNAITIDGLETINKESKGIVTDGHWSEKGQLDLSNFLTKKLKLDSKII